MLDINFLKKSSFFKELILEKGEVLFDEGDLDANIYIVLTGELIIEKYTTQKRNETKTLSILKKNDIFGEAALNNNAPKKVKIRAKRRTTLIFINAKQGISDFSKQYPEKGLNILKYIIFLSNKRLLESNALITANYKMSQEILGLEKRDNKHIFELIDKIDDIVGIDYTFYLEKNIVMENYMTLRYDSRKKGKMLDEVIEITENKLDLLELKLTDTNNYIKELNFGEKHLGYLVFFKKEKKFTDNDKKILTSIALGVSGVIKEKQLEDEERDINFMKD